MLTPDKWKLAVILCIILILCACNEGSIRKAKYVCRDHGGIAYQTNRYVRCHDGAGVMLEGIIVPEDYQ